MHEWLAAENAKEGIAVRFRVIDQPVQFVRADHFARRLDIDPATLAAQVARVEDREIKKGRKKFAALDAPFEFFDRPHSLHAKIPRELPQAPLVGDRKS